MLRVKEIMRPDPVTVGKSDTLLRAIHLMPRSGSRHLPGVEDQRLVGMVTDCDLRPATNSPYLLHQRWQDPYHLGHVTVAACMTPDPITIQANGTVLEAIHLMLAHKFSSLPVLEGNRLIGIVTVTDRLRVPVCLLEEENRHP